MDGKAKLRESTAGRVRAARTWAKLTQPELAKAVGISTASIRRVEREERDCSNAELLLIGEVCKVPRDFMLHGWPRDGEPSPPNARDRLSQIVADLERRMAQNETIIAELRGSHPEIDHAADVGKRRR